MKTYQLFASIPLSIFSGLIGCSDNTQFNEKSSPYKSNALETASTGETAETNELSTGPEYAQQKTAGTNESLTDSLDQIGSEAINSASGTNTSLPPASATATSSQRDALLSQCAQGTPKTLIKRITFPRNENCRWSTDGNLARRNGYLQAAEAQTANVELPMNTQLCSLSVASQTGTLHYDDFILLTLNSYILLSSNQKLMPNLNGSAATAYQWDFSRVRGQAVDFDSPAYCLGDQASTCQVPVTDVAGQFRFDLKPSSMLHLADQVYDKQNLNFSLIATGDNDDLDCFHTEMTLDFTLQYVDK